MADSNPNGRPVDGVLCDVGMTVLAAWLAVRGVALVALWCIGETGFAMISSVIYLAGFLVVRGARDLVTRTWVRSSARGMRESELQRLRSVAVGVLGVVLLFQFVAYLSTSFADPMTWHAGVIRYGWSALCFAGFGLGFVLHALRALRDGAGTES